MLSARPQRPLSSNLTSLAAHAHASHSSPDLKSLAAGCEAHFSAVTPTGRCRCLSSSDNALARLDTATDALRPRTELLQPHPRGHRGVALLLRGHAFREGASPAATAAAQRACAESVQR